MSLKTKLFCLIVLIPLITICYLVGYLQSTFVAVQTAQIFESQVQLLNSAHYNFNKNPSDDLAKKVSELFNQIGLENLLIADFSGKIRYAAQSALVGKMLTEVYNPEILKATRDEAKDEGSLRSITANSEKVLLSFFKFDLGDQRALLVLSKPEAAVTLHSTLFFYKAITTLAALFFFFLFASRFIAKNFTLGLVQVTHAITKLSQGDWSTPLPSIHDGQVGDLALQFSAMRKSLFTKLQNEKKDILAQAQLDFSSELKQLLTAPLEAKDKTFQLAVSPQPSKTGGVFAYHTTKKISQTSYLLFFMAEATPGIELVSLMNLSQMSLHQDFSAEPEICAQNLSLKIDTVFERPVAWSYCLCSLKLSTGELKWKTQNHPGPTIYNSAVVENIGTESGTMNVQNDDFIVLRSEKAILPKSSEAQNAAGFLERVCTDSENDKNKTSVVSHDSAYLVVQWKELV